MLRRPPRDGAPQGTHQRTYFLALAVLLLTCIPLVDAQQQHQRAAEPNGQHQPLAQRGHTYENVEAHAAAADLAHGLTSDLYDESRRVPVASPQEDVVVDNSGDDENKHHKSKHNQNIKNDARAVATLAPAQSVRAPPSRHRSGLLHQGSGISSPPRARSLEEWEVEDFILLATVDGDLYASDRKTGEERWHLEVEQPMIETQHYRLETSDLEDDHLPVDHYVWAVEPSRDGNLYIWMPGAADPSLVPTGLTMKKLVEELSPYANDNPPVIYTGNKKTTMITLDAETGRVLKWFGASGSHVNEEESCLRPTALYDMDNEECSSTGTITLGRTEYEVAITRKDGRAIAKLKYSEWTTNNFDRDLVSVYQRSLDNSYHSSRHDGRVYAFDGEERTLFTHKFPEPVARVFDVCRPWGVTRDKSPDLIVLPQPVPMPKTHHAARARESHVFINQTTRHSWYALSGMAYPLIVDAPSALTAMPEWWDMDPSWGHLTSNQKAQAMVGKHNFEVVRERPHHSPLTLPGGNLAQPSVEDLENDSSVPLPAAEFGMPTVITTVKSLPQRFASSIVELLSNPILIIGMVVVFFVYHKDFMRWSRAKVQKLMLRHERHIHEGEGSLDPTPEPSVSGHVDPPPRVEPRVTDEKASDVPAEELPLKKIDEAPGEKEEKAPAANGDGPKDPEKVKEELSDEAPNPEPPTSKPQDNGGAPPAEKKKSKAHRGRRGGVKHRKGAAKKQETSQSRDDEPAPKTVDDAVKNAQQLGDQTQLEPDVVTVTNDMQSVTGPVIKLGNIEVDTEDQLGTGSNGTLVFAGRFDGREVAVKRMLIQFYDIASQETKLLRESDDHPNVIRYYAQESREGFLYIALERCAASLADVIERPSRFPKLAHAGQNDVPSVLYQITNGIHHLHELRIVHRDLKPQNILVNMGKDGYPRLLVSDFGLCKKLEGGQSSFGATTGRAAGTSGWRAPELLVDDDKELTDASINSGSGTVLVNPDMMVNRRATRSIDIFSLGLVFFYVLTKGSHPFDCGDRYMREVNIRKGQFNLSPLDALGDFAYEAKELIGAMLNGDPKQRPTTSEIMSHPFFWPTKKRLAFLCDVSDCFEKEPRDPPSHNLVELERHSEVVIPSRNFLRHLPHEFVDSLGKQRKYTGSRLLDLLRALRNKRNHYEDMSESLRKTVGSLPEGYLVFWTVRFPELLMACWNVIWVIGWDSTDRFREYYEPAGLQKAV